ncbi:DUF2794 domain-containing protein [Pelagibius sp. Alg239-R121]|uniref:DUF2794 domain-containing protein n=1 Tax=Pelagibius sp. Alg239-R121 TaxID=2993448 RepID=UPI0024A699BD|nr:DUF2794 domain-containing protein [Pelagibius sp. Alg239-R121]
MAELYRIDGRRGKGGTTFFDRQELGQLLNLYSRRVASGEWRDYAIDQVNGSAIFSIFRHTMDSPLFSIAKRSEARGRGKEYIVYSGRRQLTRAQTMSEALSFLEKKPRVVS